MADYPVQVTFELINGRYYVTVDKYPIPGNGGYLKDLDTVTWKTEDITVDLQVSFEWAYDLQGPRYERVGPMGPFESISHPPEKKYQLVGKLSDHDDVDKSYWRYICIFFRNGQRIPWKPGATDGGGVDTHRPPPMPAEGPASPTT